MDFVGNGGCRLKREKGECWVGEKGGCRLSRLGFFFF